MTPLTPLHQQQLHALRQWARQVGKSQPAQPNPKNVQRDEAQSEKAQAEHKDLIKREHPVTDAQSDS